MPVYEISVSVHIHGAAEATTKKLRVAGSFDQHRAKQEALRLAADLPAFKEADLSTAAVDITLRQTAEEYVAARRSKKSG